MNNTPETDTATQWYEGIGWAVPARLAAKLEQERDAVTEQRDGLRSAVDYASDQLTKVTEQRDRLTEALEKIASGDNSWIRCVDVIALEALQSLN